MLGPASSLPEDGFTPAADFNSVLAKLHRSNQHTERLAEVVTDFFGNPDNYEIGLWFDHDASQINVTGKFVQPPPIAYIGAVFGDAVNCLRSALDHIVWALSIRAQPTGPPPHPIPRNSPWKRIGFPIVSSEANWKGTLADKLAFVAPDLHSRFKDVQPFVVNPAAPEQAWLKILDDLWNIDKHRVVNVGRLTLTLHSVRGRWRRDGRLIPSRFESAGPQPLDLRTGGPDAHLGRLTHTNLDHWPHAAEEMKVERGFKVNLFLDPDEPGLGKNMEFALAHMHNAVVLVAHAFEPEFT